LVISLIAHLTSKLKPTKCLGQTHPSSSPLNCGSSSFSSVVSIRATTPKTRKRPHDHLKAVTAVLQVVLQVAGMVLLRVATVVPLVVDIPSREGMERLLLSRVDMDNSLKVDTDNSLKVGMDNSLKAGTDSSRRVDMEDHLRVLRKEDTHHKDRVVMVRPLHQDIKRGLEYVCSLKRRFDLQRESLEGAVYTTAVRAIFYVAVVVRDESSA